MKQTKTREEVVAEIKSKYLHRYGLPHIGVGVVDEAVIDVALSKGLAPSYNSKDDCLVLRKVGKADRIVYYIAGPYNLGADPIVLYREAPHREDCEGKRPIVGVAEGYPCMMGMLVNRLVKEAV